MNFSENAYCKTHTSNQVLCKDCRIVMCSSCPNFSSHQNHDKLKLISRENTSVNIKNEVFKNSLKEELENNLKAVINDIQNHAQILKNKFSKMIECNTHKLIQTTEEAGKLYLKKLFEELENFDKHNDDDTRKADFYCYLMLSTKDFIKFIPKQIVIPNELSKYGHMEIRNDKSNNNLKRKLLLDDWCDIYRSKRVSSDDDNLTTRSVCSSTAEYESNMVLNQVDLNAFETFDQIQLAPCSSNMAQLNEIINESSNQQSAEEQHRDSDLASLVNKFQSDVKELQDACKSSRDFVEKVWKRTNDRLKSIKNLTTVAKVESSVTDTLRILVHEDKDFNLDSFLQDLKKQNTSVDPTGNQKSVKRKSISNQEKTAAVEQAKKSNLNEKIDDDIEIVFSSSPVASSRTSSMIQIKNEKIPKNSDCSVCKGKMQISRPDFSMITCRVCERTFHNFCYIPYIQKPKDDWRCDLCLPKEDFLNALNTHNGNSDVLSKQFRICQFILLKIFTEPESLPFHIKSDGLRKYEKEVTLYSIKRKMNLNDFSVVTFVNKVLVLFKRILLEHQNESEKIQKVLKLKATFISLMKTYMPNYVMDDHLKAEENSL